MGEGYKMGRKLICPDTGTCPVYADWEKHSKGNERLDIIFQEGAEGSYYCLALCSAQDVEGGHVASQSLRERVIVGLERVGCLNIELLNNRR